MTLRLNGKCKNQVQNSGIVERFKMVLIGGIGSDSSPSPPTAAQVSITLATVKRGRRDALNARPAIPSRSGFATTAKRRFRFLIVCQKALRVKHDQLVLFPPSAALAVSQSCCGKVAKIAQYQISHLITGNATFTDDCNSRLPFSLGSNSLSLPHKGPFAFAVLAQVSAQKAVSVLSLLIYAQPPPFHIGIFGRVLLPLAWPRRRERGKRKTSQGGEGRMDSSLTLARSLSLSLSFSSFQSNSY